MRRRVAFGGAVLSVLLGTASCDGSGLSAVALATSPAGSPSTSTREGSTPYPGAAWPTFGTGDGVTTVAGA